MRILITGSEGLVGSFMRQELEKEHELVLLDLRQGQSTSSRHHFIQGDLLDPDVCKRAVEGTQAIVHLAAAVHAWVPGAYPRNTAGTWNLLSAAAEAGVKRIAFSSTINVYGQGGYKIGSRVYTPPYLPIDEKVPPRPEDAYGLSKLANEQAMQGFSDAYGISTYCFRLPGVWRPEDVERYVPRPLGSRWTPSPTRAIDPWNYGDIRDIVAAFRCFLEMAQPPAFGISYLTADDTTRPEPTMELLERYIPEWVPLAGDRLPGFAPWFSNRRAKEDLGWRPVHTWRKPQ